jgi:hypothetical protein
MPVLLNIFYTLVTYYYLHINSAIESIGNDDEMIYTSLSYFLCFLITFFLLGTSLLYGE